MLGSSTIEVYNKLKMSKNTKTKPNFFRLELPKKQNEISMSCLSPERLNAVVQKKHDIIKINKRKLENISKSPSSQATISKDLTFTTHNNIIPISSKDSIKNSTMKKDMSFYNKHLKNHQKLGSTSKHKTISVKQPKTSSSSKNVTVPKRDTFSPIKTLPNSKSPLTSKIKKKFINQAAATRSCDKTYTQYSNNHHEKVTANHSVDFYKETKTPGKMKMGYKCKSSKHSPAFNRNCLNKDKPSAISVKKKKSDLKISNSSSSKAIFSTGKLQKVPSRNSQYSGKTGLSANISLTSKSNITKGIYKIFHYSHPGEEAGGVAKINQDNFFISSSDGINYKLVGVCDGHGKNGHLVSEFIRDNLPAVFEKEFNAKIGKIPQSVSFVKRIIKILENSFMTMNSKLSNNANIDTNFSGSTCVTTLFIEEEKCLKMFVANLGDSRAVLLKSTHPRWTFEVLSRDHKPVESDEALRIQRFGGKLERFTDGEGNYFGPLRVWIKNGLIPGLAMTRSFGDQIAASVGVLSEPETREYTLREEDKCIILASDGVWEYLSNKKVCELIQSYYERKKSFEGAVEMLYSEAYSAWKENDECVDDITILMIVLD